ncbi:MAG: hypothetical protein M9933_06765 [Chitinophagaceae bacterium]|nr:hypothetical protein [Chitinophagaceae bacterium]
MDHFDQPDYDLFLVFVLPSVADCGLTFFGTDHSLVGTRQHRTGLKRVGGIAV